MTIGVGWHRPPSRSLAPPRRGGRRTGGEKARVLSRLLASYCARASRIRLVIVSLAQRPSSCLGLLSPPRIAFHSSPPVHAERASLGHSQAPRPPCAPCEVLRRFGGEGNGHATRSLTRTYTLRNLKGMSAGVSKPRSDAWPPAPCPQPKRPSVAARHRVLQNTFPPSLHLNHFPSSPARVGVAGSVGEGGTHLF